MIDYMNKKLLGILAFCLALCLLYLSQVSNLSRTVLELDSLTEDAALNKISSDSCQFTEYEETGFTWKDSKGDEYPVFIANTGSCFVIKTSKNGNKFRAYLGKEVSEQIYNALSDRTKQ